MAMVTPLWVPLSVSVLVAAYSGELDARCPVEGLAGHGRAFHSIETRTTSPDCQHVPAIQQGPRFR